MSWMSPNMKMETKAGGAGKVFGRMFSGEHIFQNIFTAEGGPGTLILQTMPVVNMALALAPYLPSSK